MKDRIKAVREKNSLTLTKFAERLGLTTSAISCYESGKRVPSNAVLTSISKEFHISLPWLQTGEGPMEDPTGDRDTLDKLSEVYMSLPERLKSLVDVLVDMDPEWYRTLDKAFEALEQRRNKKGDAE